MVCAAGAGCGTQDLLVSGNPSVVAGVVDRAPDKVFVDWSGGFSDLHPGAELAPLDWARYVLRDGGTLADDVDGFKAAVLQAARIIVADLPHADAIIQNGPAPAGVAATVVHVAQVRSRSAPGQIGQADYDPCNRYPDDAAMIYGEELLHFGRTFDFREWVQIFANVIAHEIGHTLGYGHVERQDYLEGARPLYVELMLASHTVDEMIREQRYLAGDENCPAPSAPLSKAAEIRGAMTCSAAMPAVD